MKFRVSQEDFLKALKASDKSLSLKANLPILTNILVACAKNRLEILSTNLETATRVAVPCQEEVEGKITLPGKVLLEFVSQLPPQTITFEKLGEEALVATKGYSARLATMPAEEFPAIPQIESGHKLEMEIVDFVKTFGKVVFSASQDEGRPILNGILCEASKGKLVLVATDGYRLSFSQMATGGSATFKVVIPAKSIVEAIKICQENEDEAKSLKLTVADTLTQTNFRVGDIEFTSRLIEGEFPNWQKIIPTAFATKATLEKEELIRRVRIASIFAREAGNIVKLKFEGKTLTVAATTAQVGSNETQTEVAMRGKGGEIAFNFRYLLEALAVVETEDVHFEMSESLTPGRITSSDAADPFFHIIMPVRLQA